jgi:hypothetical protein
MSSILIAMDIYGMPFNFTIENSSKYRTTMGGVLTLVTLALFVIITILFGQDFFDRDTPRILSDTRFPDVNSTYYNFSEANFPLYFMFYDEETFEPLDLSDKLYYNFFYMQVSRKDDPEKAEFDWYTQTRILLNSTVCSENPKIKPKGGIDRNIYQCLKYPDEGGWLMGDSMMIYPVINLQFSLCDVNRQNCKNATVLRDYLSKRKIIFTVAMMSAKFYPWNKLEPLKDSMIFKYFSVHYNLHRYDAYFMNFVNLDDDQGWITKTIKKVQSFELASVDYSYKFISDENIMNHPIFYEVAFSINYSYTSKTRYYMKIQEVLAVVMGFLNIFKAIFLIICGIINPLLMRRQFINEMFEQKEVSE